MGVHVPRTREMEAEKSESQGHPNSKFKVSLGYMRPFPCQVGKDNEIKEKNRRENK